MYGLPSDFDVSPFIGRRLDSVTFYEFMVHFSFEDGPQVSAESGFLFRRSSGELVRQTPPISQSDVIGLVGKLVTSASASEEGTLNLTFDNGAFVEFRDDLPNYESYSVYIGGQRTIV
jgi:hypothetical protein